MKKPALRVAAVLAWAAGAGLLCWVVSQADPDALLASVRTLGWGIAGVVAYHVLPLWPDVAAWRLLFFPPPPGALWAWWARWVGEAGNALLPGQAGEVLRIRMAILAGSTGTAATASVVVDVSLGTLAQVAFCLVGVAIFGGAVGVEGLAVPLFLGIVALGIGAVVFVYLQRRGLFGRLAPFIAPFARRAPALAAAVDHTVAELWRRPKTLAWSAGGRFASCVLGAGEVLLVFWLLGNPLSFAEALALESLGQAARAAAFAIPAGLGVQEGALVLVATALGLPAEHALALALVKRVREVTLGVPALLSWQAAEFFRRRGAVLSPVRD
jgi:putative membrane protein